MVCDMVEKPTGTSIPGKEKNFVQFNLRLPLADHARLVEVAEHLALTPTSVLRMLVKRRHDAMLAEKWQNSARAMFPQGDES